MSLRIRGWQRIRLIVLERDGYTCRMCGKPARSVDHIIPRALGGTHEPDNLRAVCVPCNSKKGARLGISAPLPRSNPTRWQ